MDGSASSLRIGNYRLGKTLGIGSFGKVKREWSIVDCAAVNAFSPLRPACSRHTHGYGAQSGNQDIKQRQNPVA
jgi:hypothetical protein